LVGSAAVAAAAPGVRNDGQTRSLFDWARFPGVDWAALKQLRPALAEHEAVADSVLTDARYAVYLARQDSEVERFRFDEAIDVPRGTSFAEIPGLSHEMAERLAAAQPATIGQAARVRGVTPAAVTALLAHVRKMEMLSAA